MSNLKLAICAFLLAAHGTAASGFLGFGIETNKPACAFACRDAISGATLTCSMADMDHGGHMSGMHGMPMTGPECYATDDVFLQTLAWCMQRECNESVWELERYWANQAVGTPGMEPKESYQITLGKLGKETPRDSYEGSGELNQTSVVDGDLWASYYGTNTVFWDQERQQVRFGLVIALSGFLLPAMLSLLRFIPFPSSWATKANAWIIDPPVYGTKHDSASFHGLGHVPTRGQALFILYFIIINVILSAINYEVARPNTWFPGDDWRWICMLVGNRTGLLSFANMPLVFLYAGRNNLLLWLTNWSHTTFLLLHRWIAGIATLQAVIHSLIYLHVFVEAGTHSEEAKEPYWYWGIIGTLAMVILLPASIAPIRKKAYEMFLACHIGVSILAIAGCYWHIVFRYQHKWGYETWVIICMGVWAFDRIARVLRFARHGVRTALVTTIDEEYLEIIVPNVSISGHAYLYFPTLTWRLWENHPFSAASALVATDEPLATPSRVDEENKSCTISSVVEPLNDASYATKSNRNLVSGTTFYVRVEAGITARLKKETTIPVLVESGYSSTSCFSEPMDKAPKIVGIAGGVGITGILHALQVHPRRAHLYWGCRTQALVDRVRRSGALSRFDSEVVVGERMNFMEILEAEVACTPRVEVVVMVCGPPGMIDEVRAGVGIIARKASDVRVRLVAEAFSW